MEEKQPMNDDDNSKHNRQRNGFPHVSDALETEKEKKERIISVHIVYFTMFLISLGFSIILTGVWPYLKDLDPTASKEFMGYIVAANPFAQMIFAPIVGLWSNKLNSIRLPLLTTLLLFAFASAMYASLELFPSHHKYWMLAARFLVGVSSANIAACRSYVSAATKMSERTRAVSMISLAQVLGFIIGPALQAAVVKLGDDGYWLIDGKLKLNMYTASGWINFFMALINVILFLPCFFKEHKIASKEAMAKHGTKSEKETWKQHKLDYVSCWTLIVAFFILVFIFMLLETLGTPLTMDMFAWTKAEALYYMGILMSVGGLISVICFSLINPLCKYFAEHKVMIWCGFLFMVFGPALMLPLGGSPPLIYDDSIIMNGTVCDMIDYGFNTSLFIGQNCNSTELVGCPASQTWCQTTPAITLTQFIISFLFVVFGYPIAVTLIQTIFSKLLGPRPQGVWMGFLTGAGCLSRVMGPVFVTYVYVEFGIIWTFSMTLAMMLACMIWLIYSQERFIIKDVKISTENAVGKTKMTLK